MAKQTINIGTTANDGTGDPLRTAFDKVNDNTTELYAGQSLSIASDELTLTRADGTTSTVDLSPYLDEDARAISSGTLNGATGIVTFTRDDASTFTLDLSSLLDDTNLVTSVNTQTGAVVLDADDIDDTLTTNKFTSSTDISKLAGIEAGADITDTTNVEAAGALMDSEVNDLAGIKSVTISTLQPKPTEGAFVDGDKTKLDGIAAGAEVNIVDSVNSQTGAVVLDSDDISQGSSNLYNQAHTGDVTGSTELTIAADAVDGSNIADDSIDSEHYVDGSIDNAHLSDNVVSYEKIDDEFTTSDVLTAAATVDVDFDAAQIFTLTPDQSTTLNITNPKIGITKTLIVTGAGGSYTLAFTVGGASGTFNLIAGEYDDASSTKNLIQIICVSATEFWYSISQIAS
jgi:hypothetical protein